jgi:membrane protease YdiL (CAAX protease family)
MKWTEVSRHWVQTRPWLVLFWCVLAALGAIIPSTWLQEVMPPLPNIVEDEFDMILRNRFGYIVIGLMAPLAEEVVFRGAVLRSLLRWKAGNPWLAIFVSAILFSAVHMNPAQLPHTFLVGLLLGWMYYRTDSIVPGVVYHWVNNTVAYVLYNIYPNPDMTLADLFGSQQHVLIAVGFSLCILIPALFQLNLNMKK